MRNEECVADIDLVELCQILTLYSDTIEHPITVLVQYCHKRKQNMISMKLSRKMWFFCLLFTNKGQDTFPSHTACIQ